MQTIKIASIEAKSGEKNGKPWTKYTVTGEDKSIASTFDKNASSLKDGDTIEAEIELNGKYANIKTFKVVENISSTSVPVSPIKTAPLPSIPPSVGKEPKLSNDNDYWEKKQSIERISIERQVAAKLAVELLIAAKPDENILTQGAISDALLVSAQIYQWIHTGVSY